MSYFVSEYEKNLFVTRYKNPGDAEESSWEDVFRRMTSAVFSETRGPETPDFLESVRASMGEGALVCSSPQMWNHGSSRRHARNGSSCFTGRMGDSLDDFRQADADAESVYVASGGFGLLLDTVRPRGCKIKHCSEGAMGSMCDGGPAKRVEGTTGYITGSGRARGALMLQLGVEHPDLLEFVLAKSPTALGWVDDWVANASAILGGELDDVAHRFSSRYVHRKDWPTEDEVARDGFDVEELCRSGVVARRLGRVVPQVLDFATGVVREANRDWDLPMQNCNMSVRCSDSFMLAAEKDLPWIFRWHSREIAGSSAPWTKTDLLGGGLREVDAALGVSEDGGSCYEVTGEAPKYSVVIGTWEGLRQNLGPNQNQWRDTQYARFYRRVLSPVLGRYSGQIRASQIWREICRAAHGCGDPGVVFSSTYERYQPVSTEKYGPRLSNPCSEFVNSAGGSCNLASVNLRSCCSGGLEVSDDYARETLTHWLEEVRDSRELEDFLGEASRVARIGARYLTMALDYNEVPVAYIQELSRHHYRTIGIGVMGLAEALMFHRITYGSYAAQSFAATAMSEVALSAWEESFSLGQEGRDRPLAWSPERMTGIFAARAASARRYFLPEDHVSRWLELSRRVQEGEVPCHTAVTSVAPTGTISQVAGWQMTRRLRLADPGAREVTVSSGVEPPFSWGVHRQDSSGSTDTRHDLWAHPDHAEKPWMVTAAQVTPDGHVRMQAAVASFTCMSVSKTVNLPESASIHDVRRGYELAWRLGVPGTALYRDRSKPVQVLSALECPSGECRVTIDPSTTGHDSVLSDAATSVRRTIGAQALALPRSVQSPVAK